MRNIGFAAALAGALTAAAIELAVPAVASTGTDNGGGTVAHLQAPELTQWTWDPSRDREVQDVLSANFATGRH